MKDGSESKSVFGRDRIFHSSDLIQVFNECFLQSWNTELVGGGAEPLYTPATAENCARIVFTRDYFASALHEISHWCIAGSTRLQRVDYGYWYAPDGRTPEQQQLFEQVEIKPQAQEWLFNEACGHRFRVSADNLSAGLGASDTFKVNVAAQARAYCANGLNDRAFLFLQALSKKYGVENYLNSDLYQACRL